MNISNETIHIIQTVAKYLNIATAAEELNKVSSAISYTVRQVESMLQVKLFERKGRQLQLTPAGEYFIRYSKTILNDIEDLKRNTLLAAEQAEYELIVSVNNIIPQAALVDFITEFELNFPFTQLHLNIEVYNGCWDALYNHKADIVLGAPHSVPYVDGITSASIGEMNWSFVTGPNHPLATNHNTLNSVELRQHSAVCVKDTSVNFTPLFAWLLEGQKPIFVPDYSTAKALIENNIGMGYLPTHICRDALISGKLIGKQIAEQKHPTKLFIAFQSANLTKTKQWCFEYLAHTDKQALFCGLD